MKVKNLGGKITAKNLLRLTIVVVCAGIGAALLVGSHAATPSNFIEAENGALTGNASKLSDPSASNNDAVQLGTSRPANYNQIGVIGDSLTKMNGNGPTLITNVLVSRGWKASDVQVMGVYGMQIAALSGSPQNSTGNIINTWRAQGFDPRVWLLALGINDHFASSPPWDSIRQAAVQQDVNQIMSGPNHDYVIYWIGFDFFQTTYSREPEATAFDQTLLGFQDSLSNFHACSILNYYAPKRSDPNWASWWDYPTDEVHNTDLGYQVLRAPFYGQCVAKEAP